MTSRETYRIGQIEIPKIAFPENIDSILNKYMTACDVERSYVATYGIECPELLPDTTIDPKLLGLYAAVKSFGEVPANGLAALDIAAALADLEDADGAKLVLESLDASGGLGLYPVWYEDPTFHLGWYMADCKRYDEAIDAYRKSLSKPYVDGKWAVWSHLGSVCHELRRFEEAKQCYQDALQLLLAEPKMANVDLTRHSNAIKALLAGAISAEKFSGERIEFGVRTQLDENR
jgi:tetratricopeptide (TPR) repeat protein